MRHASGTNKSKNVVVLDALGFWMASQITQVWAYLSKLEAQQLEKPRLQQLAAEADNKKFALVDQTIFNGQIHGYCDQNHPLRSHHGCPANVFQRHETLLGGSTAHGCMASWYENVPFDESWSRSGAAAKHRLSGALYYSGDQKTWQGAWSSSTAFASQDTGCGGKMNVAKHISALAGLLQTRSRLVKPGLHLTSSTTTPCGNWWGNAVIWSGLMTGRSSASGIDAKYFSMSGSRVASCNKP